MILEKLISKIISLLNIQIKLLYHSSPSFASHFQGLILFISTILFIECFILNCIPITTHYHFLIDGEIKEDITFNRILLLGLSTLNISGKLQLFLDVYKKTNLHNISSSLIVSRLKRNKILHLKTLQRICSVNFKNIVLDGERQMKQNDRVSQF